MVGRRLNLNLLHDKINIRKSTHKNILFMGNSYKFLLKKYNYFFLVWFDLYNILTNKIKWFYTLGMLYYLIKINYFNFCLAFIFNLNLLFILKKKSYWSKLKKYVSPNRKKLSLQQLHTFIKYMNTLIYEEDFKKIKLIKNAFNLILKVCFTEENLDKHPEYLFLFVYLILDRGVTIFKLKEKIEEFVKDIDNFKFSIYRIKIKGMLTFKARRKTKILIGNCTNYKSTSIQKWANKEPYFFKGKINTYRSTIGIEIYTLRYN